MRHLILALGALAVAASASAPAFAHVTLVQKQGAAGAYHAAVFRVGHGCGEAATTAITVTIPSSTPVVRPQPKPGWTLTIDHAPLDPPGSDHGRPLTERVATVTWTGTLPGDQFDDFAMLIPLPDEAGELALPVVQTCGATRVAWDGADAAHPLPVLTVVAADAPAHRH
jgi:uncharacterized protein YcnI